MGGIKRLAFANFEDIASVAVTSNKISAITMESSAKFKEYALPKNTASYTTALQKDETAGTFFYQTTLNILLNRMSTTSRVEIAALAQNELVALVEDGNGVWWFLGKDEALSSTSGDVAVTGAQRTERNGYNLSLVDNSKELPYEVDDSIVAALIA